MILRVLTITQYIAVLTTAENIKSNVPVMNCCILKKSCTQYIHENKIRSEILNDGAITPINILNNPSNF